MTKPDTSTEVDEEYGMAFEGHTERSDVPTKWQGDFVSLCEAAKSGNDDAKAHLWQVLYRGYCGPIFDSAADKEAAEDAAAEFCDRYVYGWVNLYPVGNAKDGVQPPKITHCTMNFKNHIEKCLGRFIWELRFRRSEADPHLAGIIDFEYQRDGDQPVDADEDSDSVVQDFFVSEDSRGMDTLPGELPKPDKEFEYEQLISLCRKKLLQRYHRDSRILTVYEMLIDELSQERIAELLTVGIATVKRDVNEIRSLMREVMDV